MRAMPLLLLGALGCSDYVISKTGEVMDGSMDDTGVAAEETTPPEREPRQPRDTAEPDAPAEEPEEDLPEEEPPEDPPPIEEPPDVEVPTEPVYLHTGSTLYSWDPDTGLLSLIGDFFDADGTELGLITDIAIDSDGHFYGVTYEGLYGIDGHSAEAWLLTELSTPLFGLTATSDGRVVGGGDGLYIIDTETGALETLVAPGVYETSGDLVGLPDGLLYWAVREGDGLVVVDPNTGANTRRGEIGVEGVYGLGFAGESLYGFTEEGQALQIDASTGEILSTTSLPGAWYGATTNPVVW